MTLSPIFPNFIAFLRYIRHNKAICIDINGRRVILKFSSLIKKNRSKTLLSQNDFAKEILVSFSHLLTVGNDKALPKLCKLKILHT